MRLSDSIDIHPSSVVFEWHLLGCESTAKAYQYADKSREFLGSAYAMKSTATTTLSGSQRKEACTGIFLLLAIASARE